MLNVSESFASWTILVVCIAMPGVYAFFPEGRDIIKFIASSLGVAGVIISAIYVGLTQKLRIEADNKRAETETLQRTFGYLERWNSPQFAKIKSGFWETMRLIRDSNESDPIKKVTNILNENSYRRDCVIEVLNFF